MKLIKVGQLYLFICDNGDVIISIMFNGGKIDKLRVYVEGKIFYEGMKVKGAP